MPDSYFSAPHSGKELRKQAVASAHETQAWGILSRIKAYLDYNLEFFKITEKRSAILIIAEGGAFFVDATPSSITMRMAGGSVAHHPVHANNVILQIFSRLH